MESSVWTGKEAHRKDLWGVSRHRRMTTEFFHTQRENKKGKPKEQKTRGKKSINSEGERRRNRGKQESDRGRDHKVGVMSPRGPSPPI